MSRDILDLIDSTLEDYATSDDAMRWAPDAPDPTPTKQWLPAEFRVRTIAGQTRRYRATPRDIITHTTTAWPINGTWDAMVRDRLSPVFERLGVTLTDWQCEVVGRVFKVRMRVTLSRAEVERRIRIRRMHTEYHRRRR